VKSHLQHFEAYTGKEIGGGVKEMAGMGVATN